ncbi:hypothetical protein CRV24_008181 [Beauveria bassiana]|nr:hypothetical protein CRV24_008181 [Beauveria bassiana]
MYGEVREGDSACDKCRCGSGAFEQCVVLPQVNGGCANCHMRAGAADCSFVRVAKMSDTAAEHAMIRIRPRLVAVGVPLTDTSVASPVQAAQGFNCVPAPFPTASIFHACSRQ